MTSLSCFYVNLDKKFLARAAAGGLAFILFELVLILWADRPIAAYTNDLKTSTPALYDFFFAVTDIGKAKWYLGPLGIATIICAFLSRGKTILESMKKRANELGARALFLFGVVAFSGIVANIIKLSIGRARPALWFKEGVFGFDPLTISGYLWHGMPSGHTTTVFTLAFALSALYPRYRYLWFLLALFLAASRVMINMHYLSDIFAGIAVAWISVRFFINYGMYLISEIIFPIDKPLTMK